MGQTASVGGVGWWGENLSPLPISLISLIFPIPHSLIPTFPQTTEDYIFLLFSLQINIFEM